MKQTKSLLSRAGGICLALSILIALPAAALAADTYPSKPVRLIIPFAAGGSSDLLGRLISTKLAERLGKPVVMDFRGGAGTVIGTEMAAKADPDGYTLLFTTSSHTTQPALQKLPYDLIKSFTPIAKLVISPNSLVVHSSVPANSVKELIALAKQKPGQLLFVTSGAGGAPHMGAELFRMMANIDIKTVHFKGVGPAVVDLIGGHSHALIGTALVTLPHVKSGKLRMLGTTGLKRSVLLPDVPTIAEAGVPKFETTQWFGMIAPAGTPSPIVDRLDKELKVIVDSDEVRKQFLNEGAEVDYLGPAEFGQFLESELAKWARVVKEANIKLE